MHTTASERKGHHAPAQTRAAHDALAGSEHASSPTHDAIERRAYEIYEEDGCAKGHCNRNWLEAERELASAGAVLQS